jgi:hypothetical protein
MLALLSFHALAAQRGDGLRPELLALFARDGRSESGLAAVIESSGEEECLVGQENSMTADCGGASWNV